MKFKYVGDDKSITIGGVVFNKDEAVYISDDELKTFGNIFYHFLDNGKIIKVLDEAIKSDKPKSVRKND